jgi:hypothetical protein
MSITLDTTNGFVPTTLLGNGKKGLKRPKGAKSHATLNGTGLTNGLTVTVLVPPQSHNPHIQWTGTTANANRDNTQCTVELTEQLPEHGPAHSHITDDNTTVSVTANDSSTTSNTITPTVPVGP